ncbi:Cancer/testis antigen 55 [Apodemus speciosus]|uniref:Cancer/testis antigen 55 n=1 Tax=Apodemus speciosus TaxID=105296 RepID=A0ABQ0FU58_APOSI
MAQMPKILHFFGTLTAKPNELTAISRPLMIEGENQLCKSYHPLTSIAEKTTLSRTPTNAHCEAVCDAGSYSTRLAMCQHDPKPTAPQRKADPKEARGEEQRLLEDGTTLQNKQQVAAESSSNYDWMAEHFSADSVTGDNPLEAEQKLPAAVEEQSTHGLNAAPERCLCVVLAGTHSEDQAGLELRNLPACASQVLGLQVCITTAQHVDALSDDHGEEASESHMRVLLGCITSLEGDAAYSDHGLSFSLDIACKDFQPYNGDLVEIEFSEDQDTQTRRATLVKPLKHCHINEVRVTKTEGRTGVLEDTIFFTLDSLKLPSGYVPQPDDVVNVVAVQSIQPNYFWRAVAMTPVQVL